MEGIKSHPIGTNLIFASFKRRTWLPYLMYIKLLFIPQVYIEMTDLYKCGSAPFPHSVVRRATFHHISGHLKENLPSALWHFCERRMRLWQHPLEGTSSSSECLKVKSNKTSPRLTLTLPCSEAHDAGGNG